MLAPRVRGITAFIGDFSTWTWTFSTSRNEPLQLRDLQDATVSGTLTYVRAGVESRTPVECAPSDPPASVAAPAPPPFGSATSDTTFLQ